MNNIPGDMEPPPPELPALVLKRLQLLGLANCLHKQQKENGMYLCGRCHSSLDNTENPRWDFFLANLDFFIQAENDDLSVRLAEYHATGSYPKPIPPSIDDYLLKGKGLFDLYMLRSYGAPADPWHRGRSTHQPSAKVWHGDPMLDIYKAIKALHHNARLLPAQLSTLNLPYEANDEGPSMNASQVQDEDDDDNHTYPMDREDGASKQSARGGSHGRGATRGRGRGRGRGPGIEKGSATRGARAGGQVHPSWLNKEPFYWRKEPWYTAKRIKVETLPDTLPSSSPAADNPKSPWAYGPNKTSSEQMEDYPKYKT
ncbi:MAG: hypothetical protein Q9228_007813, partial [Teloschistes exilis]